MIEYQDVIFDGEVIFMCLCFSDDFRVFGDIVASGQVEASNTRSFKYVGSL